MQYWIRLIVAAIAATAASLSISYADEKLEAAIKARKSLMTLYSHNLGQLAAMAKGEIDYDPEAAKTAAENVRILAAMKLSTAWPMGSDSTALPGKTRAKLEAWTTYPASAELHKKLITAATEMAEVADAGLDGVQSNIGKVGGACKACHDDFREKQ
ncbi:MAG: cytochrome c [Rhodobacteraceae bacterium]|nr:cytochrome c [Paracoccaceae bacterium]